MDGLYSDLERITRINQLLDAVPEGSRNGASGPMRPIDTMIVLPSQDLREIAHKHRKAMPMTLRALLRGVSGKRRSENRLLSFLLFERQYTQELIELGYNDAMEVRDELEQFVSGREVPRLTAPSRVEYDLSGFDS
jgi:NTE family protein